MGRLRRFLGLPWRDKALFIHCAFLLATVTPALRIFSYKQVRNFLRSKAIGEPQPGEVQRTIWTIEAIAPFIPGANCLPQALVARHVLAGRGHETIVRIGVSDKDPENRANLSAHAWVVCRGHVILGGAGHVLADYKTIADLA